ncbi:cupin domain-containing protein [Paracidovorax avenae]|uniref:cupin domain-containing protein n=1 Tax=Paracidovorax avenae TaxID=80867 RepID=UPI001F15761A|nr:cupin domain-containing protein [Paracidovorax avenae]
MYSIQSRLGTVTHLFFVCSSLAGSPAAMAANSGIPVRLAVVTKAAPASSPAAAPDSRPVVLVPKSVPATARTVKASDRDPHYITRNGTHFTYRCHVPYTLPGQVAAIEVCEIEPVDLEILSWPETEVIHIIQGMVTVTGTDGLGKTYSAGDIFVLPQGFKGTWSQTRKLLKVAVRQPLYWKE